jgi:hypothetical protein
MLGGYIMVGAGTMAVSLFPSSIVFVFFFLFFCGPLQNQKLITELIYAPSREKHVQNKLIIPLKTHNSHLIWVTIPRSVPHRCPYCLQIGHW